MRLERQPVDLCRLIREVADIYQYVAEEKKIKRRHGIAGDVAKPRWTRTGCARPLPICLTTPSNTRTEGGSGHHFGRADERPRHGAVPRHGHGHSGGGAGQNLGPALSRRQEPFATRAWASGLSVVQAVVQAHHGTVTVTSKPGEGSEFAIVLPTAATGN